MTKVPASCDMRDPDKSTHFSVAQWVDFARGCASLADRWRMQVHLDDGCDACRGTVRFFRMLAARAAREEEYKVPERVLQQALSIFRRRRPRKPAPPIERHRAA